MAAAHIVITDGYDKLPPTELKGLGKVPTQ